jgi:hypothetical protein
MKPASIYELFDPEAPNVPRVVGKTLLSLSSRLSNYIHGSQRARAKGRYMVPSHRWVLGLLDRGVRPQIRLVEECAFEKWQERERHWISTYREQGFPLLNIHAGGNGWSALGTPEKPGFVGCMKFRLENGGLLAGCIAHTRNVAGDWSKRS